MDFNPPATPQIDPPTITRTTYGIFSCENGFDCIDSILISALSIATFCYYIKAYNIIAQDRAKLLNKMEKIVFTLALAQIAITAFIKTLYDSYFWLTTLQAISLIKDIFISVLIAYNYYLEQYYEMVHKAAQGGVVVAVILWTYSFIGQSGISLDQTCHNSNNLLFSGTNILVSIVSGVIGYYALKMMIDFQNEEYGKDDRAQVWEIKHVEMKNKQVQITVLLIATVSSNLVVFLWDIHKYNSGTTRDTCWAFYHSQGFSMFLKSIVLDVWTLLIPLWAIYYVYFMRYQSYFKQNGTGDLTRHLSDFNDLRSEMIDFDSQTDDK